MLGCRTSGNGRDVDNRRYWACSWLGPAVRHHNYCSMGDVCTISPIPESVSAASGECFRDMNPVWICSQAHEIQRASPPPSSCTDAVHAGGPPRHPVAARCLPAVDITSLGSVGSWHPNGCVALAPRLAQPGRLHGWWRCGEVVHWSTCGRGCPWCNLVDVLGSDPATSAQRDTPSRFEHRLQHVRPLKSQGRWDDLRSRSAAAASLQGRGGGPYRLAGCT